MDFVYILGTGSKWDNNELRYSLRSLVNVPHGNIFIIGECPSWVRNVTHIPAIDPTTHKMKNAIHKMRVACNTERISENFILMNDDFYFLQKTGNIIPKTKGILQDYIQRHPTGTGYYYKALTNIVGWMEQKGFKEVLDFSVHYPMPYNKTVLNFVLNLCEENEVFSPRILYGNIAYRNKYIEEKEDYKLFKPENFHHYTKKPFLSSDDKIVQNPIFQEWIERVFPQQSEYEKVKDFFGR